MIWKELLGFVAGALITVSLIPQVWRLFALKSAREISLSFTLLLLLGATCWLAYGISLSLPPVIFWNAVSLGLLFVMLHAKLRYGR